MKKALIYVSVVACFGISLSSCRSHGDCPAYGQKTVVVKKAQNI
jgi:hypothetical protein